MSDKSNDVEELGTSIVAFEKLFAILEAKLDVIDSKLKQNHRRTLTKYYRNEDLKNMFGLSSNTIVKYRLTGILPYTKLGDIFLYEATKIDKILRDNEC
ncbi:MerR family transcriptional regulator [Flavobacterium poyangense]|uniref:DNA-binding protein n=1 Tax=Flavobacterium poyangense TaxID=2204302 RepID=UPI0014201A60|nr:DNA-binding protein [Flavobacterium sp. JXAS1]